VFFGCSDAGFAAWPVAGYSRLDAALCTSDIRKKIHPVISPHPLDHVVVIAGLRLQHSRTADAGWSWHVQSKP